MGFPMKIRSSMKNNNSDHKDSHVGPLSQLVLILGYKQGSYASWKPLNCESTPKALKVLENLFYSFLIHESPWIIIDSRFHFLKSPSSRHTYVTIIMWGREWLPVPLHYFQACTLSKNEEQSYCQTIFIVYILRSE